MNGNRRRKTGPEVKRERSAFTLVELVMVVTIIGIVAAIAVPRMAQASSRATASAIQATLATVRKAVDCYYAEHGRYPGYDPASGVVETAGTSFINQLTMYTDESGNPNGTYGSPFFYGPYLRKPFPRNPINKMDTVHVKATPAVADPADGSVGWVAVLSHGYFGISATDSDLDTIAGDTGVDFKKNVRVLGAN